MSTVDNIHPSVKPLLEFYKQGPHTWRLGGGGDRNRGCLVVAAGYHKPQLESGLALIHLIADAIPGKRHPVSPVSKIIDWNDTPGRTHADVISLLESIKA